jgi:hypothetical protein
VAWPTRQGKAHDAPDTVEAPQGAIFLARCASTVAIGRYACDFAASFLLGRIVACKHDGLTWRHPFGSAVDETGPQLPAGLVAGATQEDIDACKVFDPGRTGSPQIGGDGGLF